RAVELDPLIDVVDDVIGALGNLEMDRLVGAMLVELEGEGIGLANAARASENLACRQKRQQRREDLRRELRATFHQIVFVATERRARVVIDVVLEERYAISDAHVFKRVL